MSTERVHLNIRNLLHLWCGQPTSNPHARADALPPPGRGSDQRLCLEPKVAQQACSPPALSLPHCVRETTAVKTASLLRAEGVASWCPRLELFRLGIMGHAGSWEVTATGGPAESQHGILPRLISGSGTPVGHRRDCSEPPGAHPPFDLHIAITGPRPLSPIRPRDRTATPGVTQEPFSACPTVGSVPSPAQPWVCRHTAPSPGSAFSRTHASVSRTIRKGHLLPTSTPFHVTK